MVISRLRRGQPAERLPWKSTVAALPTIGVVEPKIGDPLVGEPEERLVRRDEALGRSDWIAVSLPRGSRCT
jgi:hypothetical protein